MRHLLSGALVAFALLVVPQVGLADKPIPCPDELFPGGVCAPDVGAAVSACCPCDGSWKNHGRYVSCAAHAVNALRKAGCLDKEARRSMKRCAARSTCGKPEGFVTCCREKPGECDEQVCAKTDPPVACTTDADCPPISKCSTKSSAELCEASGGTSGTGSCCGACD